MRQDLVEFSVEYSLEFLTDFERNEMKLEVWLTTWQVIVVAIKNRRLRLPDTPNELYEISDKVYMDSIHYKIVHTNQLR